MGPMGLAGMGGMGGMGAAPATITVPHMLTALTAYLQRLQSPDFNPGPVHLSSLLSSASEIQVEGCPQRLSTLCHMPATRRFYH